MISTNNKEKLVNFYQNTLGLELKNPNDPISSLSFPNGGTMMGFIEKTEELHQNNRIEITIHVESVRKTITDLEEKGVTFWRGFTKVAEGLHVANLQDPDRNQLSILSFGEE
jgi:predicted enzyme related to lactoylglutathione lyase